ncbi:hypothetical protein AV530_011478 [Patagioenas fasciata monilis]|uniref:Leucine-rich repeat-containing protein 73 n=1 Tax=Patagioenas fasciata monilis TaxID=372326 RepID=A0A1V4K9Y5_PATFA|nr:hypothetical protein AV530_011478 [Patagioenas fasciata monilis]
MAPLLLLLLLPSLGVPTGASPGVPDPVAALRALVSSGTGSLPRGAVASLVGIAARRAQCRVPCGADGWALSHLTLAGNHLGDSDVLEVARCLRSCPALVSLDLSANPGIGVTGLRALLDALGERGRGLRFLSLAGCSVDGPSDTATWAKISLIQDLRLCGRRITQRGATGATGATLSTLARHRKLFCKSH